MVFNTKTQDEITYDIILNLFDNVSDITDANIGAVLNTLVESISSEIKSLYDDLNDVYLGTRVDTSTGDDLDQLAKLVGIVRKQGTYANGNVTFKRNTAAPSNFNIAGGSLISTQPNTGEDQLRFLSSSTVTFQSSISNESHLFKAGIYDYQTDERFIANTSSVVIDGQVTSAAHTFTQYQDFDVVEDFSDFLVDVSTLEEVDDCDSTTDWTSSVDAIPPSLSTNRKQGSYSLELGKIGTTSNDAYYSKILSTSYNGRGKQLVVWLYFQDQATINKLNRLYVYAGSGGGIGNSYKFTMTRNQLEVGWNLYRFDYNNVATEQIGNPAVSAINYLRIHLETVNTTDTISDGWVKMDFWNLSETSNYTGDIVRWTPTFGVTYLPDDSSDFEADYQPLSKEVDCYAENVGANYNVGSNRIIYRVANIPNINTVNNYSAMTGGSDTETDDDLRARVLYATELKGRATAKAIEQAVLGVEGVQSVTVDDMPLTSTSGEIHTYFTGTNIYKLDREVLSLNSDTNPTNIVLRGTVSATPYMFMYGTDYVAVYDAQGALTSEYEFQTAGTKPDTGTNVTADYQYRHLGFVNVFVTGVENPLPASILADVEATVDDYKAAGIEVNVVSPTVQILDISVSIAPDTVQGYSFTSIKEPVEDAITIYANNLKIGEAVYIAKLYDVIMNVTGVLNASIVTPSSDVIVDSDKIVRSGTITVNSL